MEGEIAELGWPRRKDCGYHPQFLTMYSDYERMTSMLPMESGMIISRLSYPVVFILLYIIFPVYPMPCECVCLCVGGSFFHSCEQTLEYFMWAPACCLIKRRVSQETRSKRGRVEQERQRLLDPYTKPERYNVSLNRDDTSMEMVHSLAANIIENKTSSIKFVINTFI